MTDDEMSYLEPPSLQLIAVKKLTLVDQLFSQPLLL